MTSSILDEDFQRLLQSLPAAFRQFLKNEEIILIRAYPLFNKICKDRDLVERLKTALQVPESPSGLELGNQLATLCQELEVTFNQAPLFPYRLPIVLSEFPIHSRAINQAIKDFNVLVESLNRNLAGTSIEEKTEDLITNDLAERYKEILKAIREHGVHCDGESLGQLLEMSTGWSYRPLTALFKRDNIPQIEDISVVVQNPKNAPLIHVFDIEQPTVISLQNPFLPDYTYNYNGAGRVAYETEALLLNAFGMKIGGHFDAQVKYSPRFIPLDELHALIRRQLSHRLTVPQSESFQLWLETTLNQLGVQFIQRNEGYLAKDLLVNPFLTELVSFLSPEKIQSLLKETLKDFASEELKPNKSELDIIAQYLFELLQGFQINPGQALGIGANWDGTVNLSNEAGAYAFKFREAEAEWGRRFKQLSLHRQGPSEAKMNAALGLKFEVQSLLTRFEYMSQLQPSEYKDLIYNALIDNLISELFPEPAYFENAAYQKYQKHYVASEGEQGTIQIDSFYKACNQGTYFKDKQGNPKQTPMYRSAGTLDVMAFPRNTTYSEQSRVCYAGNPLGPLQLQYAQALYKSARGHVVYNPIGPDQFLEDAFYGQVIRGDNGDYLPFIGVVPKNFDKYLKQDNELCASFVMRMLQSARVMEHCPTFKKTYEQMKTQFLPLIENQAPVLPKFCADYLIAKQQKFATELACEDRNFIECEKQFYSLFKNLIYSLYGVGQADEHFKHGFLSYINSHENFYPVSKAKCEKLIRDLTVTRPVSVSVDSLARYDEVLSYLRALTTFFYPKPTDSLAQEIARLAQLYVNPLVQSEGIKKYFEQQQHNKQTNLSRKQTPGMLFSALKNDGPSKTIVKDYQHMHRYNFPSYYRDPDGTPNGEPQSHDCFLDWSAKKLGAGLQLMHKYHPLALIHYPISETYLHVKQRMAEHPQEKILWALEGGLEGFFWHGLAKGLWCTTTTPFFMLNDALSWQYHQFFKNNKDTPINNPLALPAAPANEPSIKALEAALSRDFLLELLGRRSRSALKKIDIIDYATQLMRFIYPYLTERDSILCYQKLKALFPLSADELHVLFNPLLRPQNGAELSAILHQYSSYSNKSLLQAVFRCLTHPQYSSHSKGIIKDTESFFGLSSKQNSVLSKILELYNQTSPPNKQKFLELFQFEGVIHKALLIRDQYIQKIQCYILNVFNEEWLLDLLFTAHIDELTAKLTPEILKTTISKLPLHMKYPLKELLTSNNPKMLDNYFLLKEQTAFLLKAHSVYQHMSQEKQNKIIHFIRIEKAKDNKIVNLKEKAHQKWAKFTERELRHQLLSIKEAYEILLILDKKLPTLRPLIIKLNSAYQSLIDDNSVNLFYKIISDIDTHLNQLMSLNKKIDPKYTEAQSLLNNFLNITMNALINSRLDKVDIFGSAPPKNPLLAARAIELWLSKLARNNRDLRSLMEQQVHQSPSLDHAVWRSKCILQVLEGANLNKKIAKTGMQSLLRFWSQHKDNSTFTGEKYTTPETGETDKSTYEVLIKDSTTMQHALTRVQFKLPQYSIFRDSRLGRLTQHEPNNLNM